MQNVYFEDFEDLTCDIADKFDAIRELEEYNDVAIIAKYEEARQIIKGLLCIGYDLHSIDLHDEMWENYDAEYVVSLTNICGENEIWCEPMLRNSGYLTEEAPVIYVLDNCSSKVIPYCKGKVVFEVAVGEEECDCEECCGCKEETNLSSAISKYFENGKEITKEEFDKKYAEFENKYMNNIRYMLLNYCEFMDEMNEWQKLFRW